MCAQGFHGRASYLLTIQRVNVPGSSHFCWDQKFIALSSSSPVFYMLSLLKNFVSILRCLAKRQAYLLLSILAMICDRWKPVPFLNEQHPHEDHRHKPSASKVQIEIRTLGDRILQSICADPSWRLVQVLGMLKKTGALEPDAGVQILHGLNRLTGSKTLADIGASNGSQLTVVFTKPSYILTACLDFHAKLWDPMTGICVLTLQGHKAPIKSAVFSPDAHQVLTHSFDGTAKLWFVDSGECLFTFQPSVVNVFIAAFSPDGLQVLTTDDRTQMSLWCSVSGVLLKRFGRRGDQILIASFSPNGQQVLEVSFDRKPQLWCDAMKVIWSSFSGYDGRVSSAILSPDAQWLLTSNAKTTAKLWSAHHASTCTPSTRMLLM